MTKKITGAVEKTPRKLYKYQQKDLRTIFEKLAAPGKIPGTAELQAIINSENPNNPFINKQTGTDKPKPHRLLYQLPTGGGKTVVFSAITKEFLRKFKKKVLILTHRIELCRQTANTLDSFNIKNKLVDSTVKTISRNSSDCYVAMVETLNNRIEEGAISLAEIGLVIIDEAHHNSFHKLLPCFEHADIIGVTATPLSSDAELPMKSTYDELIVGENIGELIRQGYLAKPVTFRYDVELNGLQTGSSGDFTISTSDELYSSRDMLDLLLDAYQANSLKKKTLIFNNGIFTSKNVYHKFLEAGCPVKHLDNNASPDERAEILAWFKKTKGAVLTSVSILTTGFDEPTVQTIILNRATTSLTLYHQMIGRGSRTLPQKKKFTIIDLGNNTERFGDWEAPIDWQEIFACPEIYTERINSQLNRDSHNINGDLRSRFPNSSNLNFDIQAAHGKALEDGEKPITVLRDSIRQHSLICIENGDTICEALALAEVLSPEITWRVKQYTKCLGNVTKNYREWLQDDYKERLKNMIQKLMKRRDMSRQIA